MNIEQVALNAIQGIRYGYEFYVATAKAMDSLEASSMSGASKRDAVLGMIKGMFEEVWNNWEYWSELLIKFINSIKTIYNLVKPQ